MSWTLSEDADLFARQTLPLLAARPVENTLALTILSSVRAGHRYSEEPPLFGWYDAGELAGAVLMTPPHPLLLASVPEVGVVALVAALRDRGVGVPGVNGPPEIVDMFAAAWSDGTSLQVRTVMESRLYRLGRLRRQGRQPSGRGRLAAEADLALVLWWFQVFQAEIEGGAADTAAAVAARIADNRIWLWEDPVGTPVSLAGRQKTAAGVSRVGPVYTPPEHRRHGYATAVTALVTADALEVGADDVVLFTDLGNPTSNAIYQELGYEPAADRLVVAFIDEATQLREG